MQILIELLDHPGTMTVSEIASRSPVHVSVVSRHLRQLEQAGLVSSERQGRSVHYQAERVRFATILRELAAAVDQ